jgi:hypothetical protein
MGLERMAGMRRGWKEWLGRDGDGKNGWDEMELERPVGMRWGWKEWLGDGVGKTGKDELRFEKMVGTLSEITEKNAYFRKILFLLQKIGDYYLFLRITV